MGLLFWGEGRAIKRQRAITEAMNDCYPVKSTKVEEINANHIVSTSGSLDSLSAIMAEIDG